MLKFWPIWSIGPNWNWAKNVVKLVKMMGLFFGGSGGIFEGLCTVPAL